MKIPDAALEPIAWSDVDGWASDDHAAAFATFLASCRPIVNGGKAEPDPRPMASAIKTVCGRAKIAGTLDSAKAGAFFEDNFRPAPRLEARQSARAADGLLRTDRRGLPVSDAVVSRIPFTVGRMISSPGGARPDGFPNKGGVSGRCRTIASSPYFDRAEIEDGALDGRHLEICWIKDPLDAMFIQIQGSARVRLEDGSLLRIDYDDAMATPSRSGLGRHSDRAKPYLQG